MAKETKHIRREPVSKRTSIGGKMTPLNKGKRRQFKPYNRQGR